MLSGRLPANSTRFVDVLFGNQQAALYYVESPATIVALSPVEEGRTTFTAKSKEYVNPRFKVDQIWPVSFYDDLLCRRAFNLTPTEVKERLNGKIEHARLLHNGVYLVGSSQVLSLVDAQRLCRETKSALLGGHPVGVRFACVTTLAGHPKPVCARTPRAAG